MTPIKKDATVRPERIGYFEKLCEFKDAEFSRDGMVEVLDYLHSVEVKLTLVSTALEKIWKITSADAQDTAREALDQLEGNFTEGFGDGSDKSQDTAWLRGGFLSRGAEIEKLESRIQELESARNQHWRGEEMAVRQLEIVKAQGEGEKL